MAGSAAGSASRIRGGATETLVAPREPDRTLDRLSQNPPPVARPPDGYEELRKRTRRSACDTTVQDDADRHAGREASGP